MKDNIYNYLFDLPPSLFVEQVFYIEDSHKKTKELIEGKMKNKSFEEKIKYLNHLCKISDNQAYLSSYFEVFCFASGLEQTDLKLEHDEYFYKAKVITHLQKELQLIEEWQNIKNE